MRTPVSDAMSARSRWESSTIPFSLIVHPATDPPHMNRRAGRRSCPRGLRQIRTFFMLRNTMARSLMTDRQRSRPLNKGRRLLGRRLRARSGRSAVWLIGLRPAARSAALGRGYLVIRHLPDAAYFFLGSAARNKAIHAPWVEWPLVAHAVYARMCDGDVLRTRYSRLTALRRRLDPDLFVAIDRSLVVNIDRMVALELGKISRIGVQVGTRPRDIDLLPVSRSRLRRLRALIG